MAGVYLIVIADAVKTGGMDRANYALIDWLARRGDEVHVVAHRVAESLRGYANLTWHAVPRPGGHDALGWDLLARMGSRWAGRLAPRGARVMVNGGNCAWADCNWVHYVHAAYAPTTARERNPVRRGWNSWKRGRALGDEAKALRRARVVITNSERTRNDVAQIPGVAGRAMVTVYYGCDGGVFHPASADERAAARQQLGWATDRPMAIFIGALGDRRKGFDTLFSSWRELCAAPDWNLDLAVVGVGRELPAWRQRAAEAGLGDRCRFLGFRADVPVLLQASDLLVAPTRYEAFGLGVQEALACGLPALVSAGAGVTERMPRELAPLWLNDPDSVGELTTRFRWWRDHRASLSPALASTSERIRTWTWDHMAASIVAAMDGSDGLAT